MSDKPVQEMPRFDFSEMSFDSDEALEAALVEGQAKERTFFDPGLYDVTIEEATFVGMSEKDPNWGKVQITLRGAGERRIRDTILVPYKDVKFGKDGTLFPFQKLKNFVGALGLTVDVKTLGDTLKTVFAKPERLVGRHVKTDIGYRKGFVRYAGKAADGKSYLYEIVQRDKNVVSENGSPLRFPSRDAAEAHANSKNIAIEKFVNVLAYNKSEQDSTAADVNW